MTEIKYSEYVDSVKKGIEDFKNNGFEYIIKRVEEALKDATKKEEIIREFRNFIDGSIDYIKWFLTSARGVGFHIYTLLNTFLTIRENEKCMNILNDYKSSIDIVEVVELFGEVELAYKIFRSITKLVERKFKIYFYRKALRLYIEDRRGDNIWSMFIRYGIEINLIDTNEVLLHIELSDIYIKVKDFYNDLSENVYFSIDMVNLKW